jgi:argininosuccinate lyase
MIRVVTESTVLKPDAPARAADESWVVATDLAEALARSGVPFHKAHQIAGKLVLESVKSGRKPADWTAEQLVAFAPEFKPEMIALMKPEEGMKTRSVPGGTAPETVEKALVEAEARLAKMEHE